MNAQKFVKENKLQNIELEIDGKRESILSILERFQQPIMKKSFDLDNTRIVKQRMLDNEPMSLMTEMQYKREIVECGLIIKTLMEL